MKNKIWFLILDGLFVTGALFFAKDMVWYDVLLLGMGASFVGRAVAYLKIFEWVREPFCDVIPHSAGVGDTVEPKEGLDGWKYALAHLISCPVCAGTWAALALSILPQVLTYLFAASSIAWLFSYITEAVEWSKHRNWHEAGKFHKENGG